MSIRTTEALDILGALDFDLVPVCEQRYVRRGEETNEIGHKSDPPPADWLVAWINPLTCGCAQQGSTYLCDRCWHTLATSPIVWCGCCHHAVPFMAQVLRRTPVRGC